MDSGDLTTIDETLRGLGTAAPPAAIEALVRKQIGSTRITAQAADALLAELGAPVSRVAAASAPALASAASVGAASTGAASIGAASTGAASTSAASTGAAKQYPWGDDEDDVDVIVDTEGDLDDDEVESIEVELDEV